MLKKSIIAIIAIFFAWSILDFVMHGYLLMGLYEATANLWRPEAEMKMMLMHLVTVLYVIFFVGLYNLVGQKTVVTGLKFGLLFGLATGISMGFGSYSYMPIPLVLAVGWMVGNLVQTVIAGLIVGAIVK